MSENLNSEVNDDILADIQKASKEVSGEAPAEAAAPDNDEIELINPETGKVFKDDNGRLRSSDGKFASDKPTVEAPAEAAPVAKELASTDAVAKAPAEQTSPSASGPPVGWTPDAKALWGQLPPAIHAAVLKREEEASQGGRQWSEQRQTYERMLAPLAQESQRRGMTTEQGIQRLLDGERFLTQQPVEAIKWLAKTHGLDLATLAGSPAASDASQGHQPDVRTLIQQELGPILQPIMSRIQEEEQQKLSSMDRLVADFASKNQHYATLENEIYSQIALLKEENARSNRYMSPEKLLEMGYDRAVHANPQTRALVMNAQIADAEAKRKQEAAAHAANARKAASSVTGGPSGFESTRPADSLEEELMRSMGIRR